MASNRNDLALKPSFAIECVLTIGIAHGRPGQLCCPTMPSNVGAVKLCCLEGLVRRLLQSSSSGLSLCGTLHPLDPIIHLHLSEELFVPFVHNPFLPKRRPQDAPTLPSPAPAMHAVHAVHARPCVAGGVRRRGPGPRGAAGHEPGLPPGGCRPRASVASEAPGVSRASRSQMGGLGGLGGLGELGRGRFVLLCGEEGLSTRWACSKMVWKRSAPIHPRGGCAFSFAL